MKFCPSPEQLQRMLDEQMNDAEASAIEGHVQACAACRQALERLTASRAPGTEGLLDRARRAGRSLRSAGESPLASTLVFSPHAAPADEQLGRYSDVRFHAKGGLGEVFIGTDPELHRTVAIKRIRESHAGDPDRDRRFLVEAEVTARLEHPGVVPVHELLRDPQGRPCYAMRFVAGETLSDAIERYHSSPAMAADERNVQFRQLLQCLIAVCNTVAYAHSRGIIHRDLKPQNVMLGKFGETLVMDWGLAKVVGRTPEVRKTSTEATLMPASGSGSTETQLGSALGTPQYMSPEQAAGRWDVVDPATDIYSLGATFYTLLTGATPFPKENWPALQQKIQRGTFPRPRQVRKETPAALEAICLKAMAMNPEDRYASATALARDVEHWLADEPVTAWREPATTKARRWMKRRRSLVAGVVSLLVAAVVALAAGTILLSAKQIEIEAERNTARGAEAQARKAAAQAEAINRFLTEDLLFQAAPEKNAREKKVTVEEVLHKAAKNIEGNRNLADQPEVEASLRLVIANTLERLGDPKGALPHFRRALALRRQALGPTHPDTLTAQEDLAFHLGSRLWQVAEAAELSRATWEARIQAHGPEDPRTLESLDTYSSTLSQLGQHAEAEKLSRQCLEARERVQGKSHKQTLQSMNNLGVQLGNQGRFAEAEAVYAECFRRHDDPNHVETLSLRNNLGFVRLCMGRFADAEATLRESLSLSVKLTGQASFQSSYFQHNLARTLGARGELEEAERLSREVVARRRDILPAGNLHIGRSLIVLSTALVQQAKWADADSCLSEALDIFREQPNAEDWIAEANVFRGAVVAGLGRFEEAERLLAAGWPRLAADRRVPTWHKRLAAETVAKVYEQAGKTAEADAWRNKLAPETK